MTKTGYERVIGIDVASKKLDISDSKGKLPAVIENTMESIESKLVKKIGASESTELCYVSLSSVQHNAAHIENQTIELYCVN